MEKRTSFTPGQVWLDTDGNRIQAHGGSILYADGAYYWYGENKDRTDEPAGIWHWGVRLYSSKDLYNWKSEGIILPPEPEDEKSPVHPSQYMDRPHILYNEKTKKYVMWVKIMSRGHMSDQFMTIAVADKITDTFRIIGTRQLLNMSTGDFDLAVDRETKKAYIYFDKVHDFVHMERQHQDIVCAELTDDYTDVTGDYANYHNNTKWHIGYEAPAFCEHGGKKYVFLSHTTGYMPNPTDCIVSDGYFGPWENIGTVHENDEEHLSFRSQICSVFRHPTKKLYIALADRWLTHLPKDLPHNLFEIYNSSSDPEKELLVSEEEYARLKALNTPAVRKTMYADYVWLPIFFEDGRPVIRWFDEWKVEDFEDET